MQALHKGELMALRVCSASGCPELVTKGRCPTHAAQHEQARGSRQARGYDAAHTRLRARWARKVATGQVMCARCGERISVLEPWDLDHTDDRTAYLGPSHQACNRSRVHHM
jgi:hypothetical protein